MTRVQRLELSPTTLVAVLVFMLFALSAATWFVILEPKRTESGNLASQIQVANDTIHARAHVSRPTTLRHAEGLFVRRALPDSVAMPQLILELGRVASEEHVSLDSITPSAATPYSGFSTVPMSVVVTGRYAAIEGFLREVRNQVKVGTTGVVATGRLFDVLGISLQPAQTLPLVSATLTMDAFVYSGVPLVSSTSASSSAT